MHVQEKSVARVGSILFYLGGAVWGGYALARYALGWDVTMRQFLPYHLTAIIPGVLLRRGAGPITRWLNKA